MSNTAYIGADALASLIYVMNAARCWKRELWLAGLDRLLVKLWALPAAALLSHGSEGCGGVAAHPAGDDRRFRNSERTGHSAALAAS